MESGSALKKQFYLEGLCCANCAAKIENKVNELEEIETVNLDFVTKKLTIQMYKKSDAEVTENKIIGIVKSIEDEVKVINLNDMSKDDHEEEETSKADIIRFAVGVVIFIAAYIFKFPKTIDLILYVISYIIVGGDVLIRSIKNIGKGQIFDENFLMVVATIGAFAIKEYPEAVSVMIFYQIGEFLQDAAVEKSRKSISALMDIKPDFANLIEGENVNRVNPEEVAVGNTILVKPGEKVPLDGTVIEGESMLDTSAVTGESVPRKAKINSEVFSGSINKEGLLKIEVTKEFKESTVSKILDLVENASSKKAVTEKFITKFARYYTPAVVCIALFLAIVPPLVLKNAVFSNWIYRALVFLVASCPCAIILSVPLSFFGGIGSASKQGILVKGGNYIEALKNINTVVFDKTGTLTEGKFNVNKIQAYNGFSDEEVLKYAAYAEVFSNHPIAISIRGAYKDDIKKDIISNYKEVSGFGVQAEIFGKTACIGNANFMEQNKVEVSKIDLNEVFGTIVHASVDGVYAGYIVISDNIKKDAVQAVKELKAIGVKTVMLTGDNKKPASIVANKIGIDEVFAELLPQDKVQKIEDMYSKKTDSRIAFVGDGINDAPVLARADVGISMGSVGSDAAVEASDVVIMNDELHKIYTAIKIAKKTNKVVWQNIIFAIGIKLVVLTLGALGYANIWEAVFADTGVALIAVVNSLRVLRID
ncbi:heavy metal translocating P-type ATPase [Clostridium guangxiense]|uniref:heavy metal translocating P-type ATPase n=1 Tax=Clostridium guangxiense TaxID=1662055 RepID=UPI001E36F464|nr:heavy metal translocating P-type ATPase [Clostridium guangxiense]MCD2345299.1 cadmium-translocating P-type ATPase [Clostridium guangxiense]